MKSPLLRRRYAVSAWLLAFALLAGVGCGGGGGGSGSDRTGEDTLPVVLTLQTPLGLQGTRGVGPNVSFVYYIRDREFDLAEVEVQAGVDSNRDGDVTEDEYFAATAGPGGDGLSGLNTSPGNGSLHVFVWDSLADVATDRHVTQDFVYTQTGRVKLDDFGEPIFQNFPGVVLRIRPKSATWTGAWRYSDAFDLNNNNRPFVTIDSVVIPPEGVADQTVNEQVVVNWRAYDPDGDPVTIAVDWVTVANDFVVGGKSQAELEALPWAAASTGTIGEGTYNLASSPSGIGHQYSWDSAKDAGTVSQKMLLRFRPIDGKLEVGDWRYGSSSFLLDNYTIFTDPGTALPSALGGARAVLLRESVESVLVVGGSATDGGDGTNAATIFYPGRSQTTLGTVAAIAGGMKEPRVGHTATRLLDGRVLIVGGGGAAGAVSKTGEIYNPSTRAFSLVSGPMTAERRDHVAVLLRSGDVLVAGGRDSTGSILSSAEVFRIATSTFEAVGAALSMGDARYGAAATLLPDGRVLLAGGRGNAGALRTTEIYDPSLSSGAGGFAATDVGTDLGAAREGLTVTGTLHVQYAAVAAGGMASAPSATLERFDWKADDWSNSGATMRSGRAFHAAAQLGNGKILIAGGQSDEAGAPTPTADLYDPSADTMDVPNGDLRTAVRRPALALLERGRPVFFGGFTTSAASDRIQVFTPDGGFNDRPLAQVADMLGSLEPWSFGVRIRWRAIDPEGDPVRIVCQYKIKSSAGDDSSQLPSNVIDQWRPATMRPQTVLGEKSSGLTALSSRQDYVDTVDNPIDAPDVDPGEHLFVWDTQKDILKGNYDNVFFRIFIYGAEEGTGVESARFSIAKNAPVIARIDAPLNTSGNVVVPFWLQDGDAGDRARIVWEYGIDKNGDGKIVEAEGESWVACRRASVGSTVGGKTYFDSGLDNLVLGTQSPDPNNEYTDPNGIPWGKKHYLVWDSVYDLGAPPAPRTDVILRLTPYDFNNVAGNPGGANHPESLGIVQQVLGFKLEKDASGLYLESWAPTVTTATGTYQFEGLRLDEPLVFRFSAPVDPASIAPPDGANAIRISREGSATLVGGYLTVDNSSGKGVVTFYPYVQGLPPTQTNVLAANTGYSVSIWAYDPADRGHAIVKRLGADPSDTNARMNLTGTSVTKAFRTASGTLPSQLYLPDTIKPAYSSMTPVPGSSGASSGSTIVVYFDDYLAPGSVTPTSFIAVAKKFAGVDSVVPGSFVLENLVDGSGPGGSVRKYSKLTLTPSMVLPPDGTTIEVRIGTGLTDLRGNTLSSAQTFNFTTAAGTTTNNRSKTEEYDNTTFRDSVLTSAFWGTADPVGKGAAAGSGVAGKLTGMYDGGNAADGALDLTSGNQSLTTSSTKNTWQYSTVNVPYGRTLTIVGTHAAKFRVQGDITVNGDVVVSGSTGLNSSGAYTTSVSGVKGGAGGPGGGVGGTGGNYSYGSSAQVDGGNGGPGSGDSSSVSGGKGGLGATYGGGSYTYWAGGGGGGGHGSAGSNGGDGYTGYGLKGGKGGTAYGTATLSSGPVGGGGGGAGGTSILYYTYYSWYGAAVASSGGGGGGGLLFSANGKIVLGSTGRILANGGVGGSSGSYSLQTTLYPGGGGGGAGGSVFLQAGGVTLSGGVEVLGGKGGTSGYASYPGTGGTGGDGRVRIEQPGGFQGKIFKGTVYTSGTLLSTGNGGSVDWKITSDTTVDTTSGLGIPGSLTVSGGKILCKDFVVDATLTIKGSKPFIVEAAGNVQINGSIISAGGRGAFGSKSFYGSSSGWIFLLAAGGTAGVGGGAGGDNGGYTNTTYNTVIHPATAGYGTDGKQGGSGAGGAGQYSTNPYRYVPATYYYYYYYYYSGSGGGAGNTTAGTVGTIRKYAGTYSGELGAAGSAVTNGMNLSTSSMYGGPGGGGGANGGYGYWYLTSTSRYYVGYGPGAGGGGGGGGIMISSLGTMLLSGGIFVPGGAGGDCDYGSSISYYPGAGGGGAGGNVVLQAKSGITFGLVTVDASGGAGGNVWYSTGNSYGAGGNGGLGAIVLRSGTAFSLPGDIPTNVKYGNGTMSGGEFKPTKDGVSTWYDSGAVAPQYTSRSIIANHSPKVYVRGAHTSLITGVADPTTATAWFDVTSGNLSAINGYRYFCVWVELTGVTGAYPEVSSVTVNWTYRN